MEELIYCSVCYVLSEGIVQPCEVVYIPGSK